MHVIQISVQNELRNFEQGKPTAVSVANLANTVKGCGGKIKHPAAYLTRKLREGDFRSRWGI